MKYGGKGVIFKYKTIGATIDHYQDAKLKEKKKVSTILLWYWYNKSFVWFVFGSMKKIFVSKLAFHFEVLNILFLIVILLNNKCYCTHNFISNFSSYIFSVVIIIK